MNKKILASFFVSAAMSVSQVCYGENDNENLISNPGFEELSANGFPLEWQEAVPKCAQINTETVDDGKNSLKVSCLLKGTDNRAKGSISQTLKTISPGNYMISGSFKGDMDALYLVVVFKDKNGDMPQKFDEYIPRSRFSSAGNAEWFRFMCKFQVPAGAVSGRLVIELFGSDQTKYGFLDGLRLVKTE